MLKISRKRIEEVVTKTIEELPEELKNKLENVDIAIEDYPADKKHEKSLTLGLYQGVPVSKRGFWYGNVLPDKITIFKNNIELLCKSEEEVEKVIREVVIHELAHYFGFDEKQIREKGY